MRIGLIADTHIPTQRRALQPAVGTVALLHVEGRQARFELLPVSG